MMTEKIHRGILLILIMLCSRMPVQAQEIAGGVYWISFTDKDGNGYSYTEPEAFLSQRSIERRAWQGLGVDESDEPVSQVYVDSILSLGYEIKHVSRWLNGAVLVNTPYYRFQEILELDFVDTSRWEPETDGIYFPPGPGGQRFGAPLESPPGFDYGQSHSQIKQLGLIGLHQEGYTGNGVWIGILDAGFYNLDSLPAFEAMIDEGRLLGTRNFINDTSVFRLVNTHGMKVTSIAGGLWEGQVVGSAPHASYFLCATENIWEETRLEEIAWIAGAEFLDSLGVDVLNTSLGYSTFDGGVYDYSYEDMDGNSTFISRAASMVASKGMLSSHSAGNEGNSSWYRITAPADAFNVLSVAAVDSLGVISSFSSRGPTYDGRLNPNVAAQGSLTAYQHQGGTWGRGYGTSFSAPLIAGASACLWQAFPETPAGEMIIKILSSGNQFLDPEAGLGYGIPHFTSAFWPAGREPEFSLYNEPVLYPNPVRDIIHLEWAGSEARAPDMIYHIEILDLAGRRQTMLSSTLPVSIPIDEQMGSGMYTLHLAGEEGSAYINFIKQ